MDARLVVDADDWEGSGGWNERRRYGPLARRLFVCQEQLGLRCCDGVTAASRTLEEMARRAGSRSVHYLPNGLLELPCLPPREQARSRWGLGPDPVGLVYTRFVEVGPERLCAILSDLLRCEPTLRIVVVGCGFGNELERLAQCLGRERRVLLAGWVERLDLPWYWAAADFALYACEDNLLTRSKSPLRLVEMMAAGLPVVAHRVGETAQYVKDGLSGLLVEPGDDRGFVDGATRLAADPQVRRYLGENARSRIARYFDWNYLAQGVERFYLETADKR